MSRRSKAVVAAVLAAGVGTSLLMASSSAAPKPQPPVERPAPNGLVTQEAINKADAHRRSPVVKKEEVGPPGGVVSRSAAFHNGKVHEVRVRTRTYVVTQADGTRGTLVEEEADPSQPPPPPHDKRYDAAVPTPEQRVEMDRITGVGPNRP